MALPSIVLRADQVPIVGVQKPGRKPKAEAAAAEEKPVKKTARKPKAEAEPKAEKAPAKRTRKPKEPKE